MSWLTFRRAFVTGGAIAGGLFPLGVYWLWLEHGWLGIGLLLASALSATAGMLWAADVLDCRGTYG